MLEMKDIFTTYLVELAVLGNKSLDKVCVPGNQERRVGTDLLRSFTTLRLS